MFKKIIESFIAAQKRLLYKLEEAYEETYKETSKELNSRIEKIKQENKEKFIQQTMLWLQREYFYATGKHMKHKIVRKAAEGMFRAAQRKGDLDELYQLKYEIEKES